MGGKLYGELFLAKNPALAFQAQGFWYGLLFMGLLALQLSYGLSLLLLPLLEVSIGPGWRSLGRYPVGVLFGLFLLTRTLGLPTPGPGGMGGGAGGCRHPFLAFGGDFPGGEVLLEGEWGAWNAFLR